MQQSDWPAFWWQKCHEAVANKQFDRARDIARTIQKDKENNERIQDDSKRK